MKTTYDPAPASPGVLVRLAEYTVALMMELAYALSALRDTSASAAKGKAPARR